MQAARGLIHEDMTLKEALKELPRDKGKKRKRGTGRITSRKGSMKRVTIGRIGTAAALLGAWRGGAGGRTLTFVWHAGTCADAIVEIANDYPDKNVKIVPALVPYGPEWHNKIASEFAIKGDAFDFAMWDSQSTAEFAGGGHAYSVNKIFDEVEHPQARAVRSGVARRATASIPTAPASTGACRSIRTPTASCTARISSRIPKEKEAFKAKYGKDLAPPQTYQDAKRDRRVLHPAGSGPVRLGPDGRPRV